MNTQQKNNPILILKEYVDIINQNVEELIILESEIKKIQKRIKEIKNPQWEKAYKYFSLAKSRNRIKEKPTQKNEYKIEFFENTEILERKEMFERNKIKKEKTNNIITKEIVDEIIELIHEEEHFGKINTDELKIISTKIYNSVKEYISNK